MIIGAGGVGITSFNGYAVGVNSASTFDNQTVVLGNVYVQGYTGALGIKTSSAYDATTLVFGNVNVQSGYAGKGGGDATGIISVGSNYAYSGVFGSVTVTALNGVALGVESSSFNGSGVNIDGSVTVNGNLGATAIYDRTIYDHNASVTVGGSVDAYSSNGSATGIFAEAGNTALDLGTYVDVTVGGSVSATGFTSATGIQAQNLGGDVNISVAGYVSATSVGDATGIKSYSYDVSTINVGGVDVVSLGAGNAVGINVIGFRHALNTTVTGSVSALSYGGSAVGIEQYVTHGAYVNNVHVYGDVTAIGYTGAVGVETFGNERRLQLRQHCGRRRNAAAEAITGPAYGVVNEGETATTNIGGNVYAYSKGGEALGVFAYSAYGSDTTVDGGVSAVSALGEAVGVESFTANEPYANNVTVDGDVSARGYTGAVGVYAIGGEVNVHVGGNVSAYTISGDAFGVIAIGDNSVYVGGNASAFSFGVSNATAIYGNSTFASMYVHVGQNVYAESIYGSAYGIHVSQSGYRQGHHRRRQCDRRGRLRRRHRREELLVRRREP